MNKAEKNKEFITFLKEHPDLFHFDEKHKLFQCPKLNLSIANKKDLQKALERFGKKENEVRIKDIFSKFEDDDMVVASYDEKSNVAFLPVDTTFKLWLADTLQKLRDLKTSEKLYAGSVEAQYDNYLSVEESADLSEATHHIEDIDLDY